MTQEYDAERFRKLVLYIAERSIDDPKFGKTKLAKILFYSDFLSYAQVGHSITGATYSRFPRGPYPRALDAELDVIEDQQLGVLSRVPYYEREQQRLVPLEPADIALFSGVEISIVDRVIEALRSMDATAVSQLSHVEPAWRCVNDFEEIPYELAFVAKRPSARALERGLEISNRLGAHAGGS